MKGDILKLLRNQVKPKRRLVNKTAAITILMLLTISSTLMIMPLTTAHTPPWDIITYSYLSVAPNPIGVGQRLFVVMWLDSVLPGATVDNDIRFHNFKLTITKPDGKTEIHEWPVVTDTASSQPYLYYPEQAGDYTFKFEYPGQKYTWNQANTPGLSAANAAYENDTYLPSSKTKYLTVQEEPVWSPPNSYPMPEEYWTRPIEGQNTDWWTISSNWLGRQSPQLAEMRLRNPEDGIGPATSHVMWTKPIQEGGVVGGTNNYVPGEGYYIGTTYNRRFNNPIIMYGILYYTEPESIPVTTTTAGGLTKAVDLRTGEEIWSERIPGPNNIFQFGYSYTSGDNPNMHGTWPGILFTVDFAQAYDALTGNWMFNVTNMPVTRAISPTTSVGTEYLGPDGTIYLYQLNMARGWIAEWNSSKLWTWGTTPSIPAVVDASISSGPNNRYDWNVTLPSALPSNARIIYTIMDDMVLLSNITTATGFGPSASGTRPYMVAAVSLKPNSRGTLMWMKEYDPPPLTRSIPGKLIDEENRVFLTYDKETSQIHGHSLDTGDELWVSTLPEDSSDFILYSYLGAIGLQIGYGKVYFGGYGGILHTYDIKTGELLWTYGNGGPGNTTYAGTGLAYGRYPIYPGPIANGIIYLDTGEHSAQPPLYKGALVRALNATTGEEIWTLTGWGGHHRREGFAVADGFLTYLNHYDMQIYSIGRGPSATTITAPQAAIPFGQSLVISGTVIDIASGTKQKEQAARFPYGVPAVSDANMSAWMEYVYMQKPRPKDIIGVSVTIDVIDANGNIRNIGTAISDANGFYSFMWKPDIPGKYTVTATFAGSEAYWPSRAETAFGVDEEVSQPSVEYPQPIDNSMTIIVVGIAILVAVVVVGAVIVLMLRKRP